MSPRLSSISGSSGVNAVLTSSTKFPVYISLPSPNFLWIHDLWCFSFNNNGLPGSCGTSAQGAQKDTRASQDGRNTECSWRTSGCSLHQNVPKKMGRTEQWEIKTYNTNNWNLQPPAQQPQSLLIFFQHLNGQMSWVGDGTIQEPKRGNHKNQVRRLNYWKREHLRWNHDILDSQIWYITYFNQYVPPKYPNNKEHKMWWMMRSFL